MYAPLMCGSALLTDRQMNYNVKPLDPCKSSSVYTSPFLSTIRKTDSFSLYIIVVQNCTSLCAMGSPWRISESYRCAWRVIYVHETTPAPTQRNEFPLGQYKEW